MPNYGRKRKTYSRKATSKFAPKRTRKTYRRGKYSKVSRRRPAWTAGTVVSPLRKFTYNDEDYSFSLTDLLPYSWKLFRGNSCYDPDYDIGGIQPYGFDQLCPAFYKRYCVSSSKITVYPFISATGSTFVPPRIKLVIVPYQTTTIPYTEYTDVIRMPYARSSLLAYFSNDNKTCKCSSFAKTSQILGKNLATDADAVADYNANPTNQWYWFVFAFCGEPPPSDEIVTIRYDVKITYYTRLSQKVEIDNS